MAVTRTRVKVCCISSIEEANLAIQYGADAIGLVGPMPSGPGIIDNSMIHNITAAAPASISTFLLTSETDADSIIAHHKLVNTNTIQLVDAVDANTHYKIKQALPTVKLVQVIHVMDEESIAEAKEIAHSVDTILLDSGNPNLAIKELGGTGRVHNWEISRRIVEAVDTPVFLAGGLNPDNVAQAIKEVKPFGVDLCSGIRTDKKLDEYKLAAFFSHVK